MASFLTRSQAARAAIRAGHMNFITRPDPRERKHWIYHDLKGTSPAIDWADRDYVNHVESDWIDEGRSPGYVGVIVVTCTLGEIPAEDRKQLTEQGIRIEPLTPELFDKGDRAEASRVSKARPSSASPRAKSDVESPTKLVWSIADGMPNATRSEIVAACEKAGVNKATASTQFYRWQKAKKL